MANKTAANTSVTYNMPSIIKCLYYLLMKILRGKGQQVEYFPSFYGSSGIKQEVYKDLYVQ